MSKTAEIKLTKHEHKIITELRRSVDTSNSAATLVMIVRYEDVRPDEAREAIENARQYGWPVLADLIIQAPKVIDLT